MSTLSKCRALVLQRPTQSFIMIYSRANVTSLTPSLTCGLTAAAKTQPEIAKLDAKMLDEYFGLSTTMIEPYIKMVVMHPKDHKLQFLDLLERYVYGSQSSQAHVRTKSLVKLMHLAEIARDKVTLFEELLGAFREDECSRYNSLVNICNEIMPKAYGLPLWRGMAENADAASENVSIFPNKHFRINSHANRAQGESPYQYHPSLNEK